MKIMRNGEPTGGKAFFDLLYKDSKFCEELGKVALSAGRLEAELMFFLNTKGNKTNLTRKTLGQLIKIANEGKHLDKSLIAVLRTLCEQRNYLAHNIYALFIELIEQTILGRSNLLDSDVDLYTEKARQLQEDLIHLANIIKKL